MERQKLSRRAASWSSVLLSSESRRYCSPSMTSLVAKLMSSRFLPSVPESVFFRRPRYFSVSVWESMPMDSSMLVMISLLVLT